MMSKVPFQSGQHRPENVGIIGMDVYIPKRYVDQEELEEYYGYSKGKITSGLGQVKMSVCDDREDICSMCMTVVRNCLEKYGISYESIGRLEVGTETLIDKSKSVKSVVMQLFKDSKNTDIEGVDTVNACYGGTNAVLNSINWVESSSWDGRYALAVAADIAVYDKGPARPSGGAAAVAIIIGPDAPVVPIPGLRASYMMNVYDFYKPILQTEYPHVDGQFSLVCYYKAFDECYQGLLKKCSKCKDKDAIHSVKDVDYLVFHTPFTKLVCKCAARIIYNEYLLYGKGDPTYKVIPAFDEITPEKSYTDKNFEKELCSYDSSTSKIFDTKVIPAATVSKHIGNSYCASVWVSLASLLSSQSNKGNLKGKKIIVFSYGSGLASTAMIFKVRDEPTQIAKNLNLDTVLQERTKVAPSNFEAMMDLRQCTFSPDYTPKGEISAENYFPGTYYLDHIDDKYRRSYSLYK